MFILRDNLTGDYIPTFSKEAKPIGGGAVWVEITPANTPTIDAWLAAKGYPSAELIAAGAAPIPVNLPNSDLLTKAAFYNSLTQQERIALRAASKTDSMIEDFIEMLDLNGSLSISENKQIFVYMYTKGYISTRY
jgi:hypothetical protein